MVGAYGWIPRSVNPVETILGGAKKMVDSVIVWGRNRNKTNGDVKMIMGSLKDFLCSNMEACPIEKYRVTISPAVATLILEERNINFRRMNKKRVQIYSRQMYNGDWHLSTLEFDCHGMLLNGQHRLAAVVHSGVSIPFLVLLNCPASMVPDNGQNRTKVQMVSNAYPDMKRAGYITTYANAFENIMNNGANVSNTEIVRLVDRHKELANLICDRVSHARLFCSVPIAAAFGRAILRYPLHTTRTLKGLSSMANMDFSDPRMQPLHLFAKYMSNNPRASHGGNRSRKELYLRCARCILAYLSEETISNVRVAKEDPFDIQ